MTSSSSSISISSGGGGDVDIIADSSDETCEFSLEHYQNKKVNIFAWEYECVSSLTQK